MKKTLGLDLGTNSIGWALVESDFNKKEGSILGAGSRIIPMGQDVLGKFDAGVGISRTADRTHYRGVRRLYQRDNLRRDRLHRMLNLIGFLPEHYAAQIDFEKRLGQFKKEVKLNYKPSENGYQFIFMDSFHEMARAFKEKGYSGPIPFDWTIYYLRTKALRAKVSEQELAWIILNFNQKRGYYQLRGEEPDDTKNKQFVQLKVKELIDSGEEVKGNKLYDVLFENGWKYDRQITKTEDWINRTKEFIVTIKQLASGETKYSYKAVDSEKDWPAIKAKTEQDIENSEKTVGEFIYNTLLADPSSKIRGKLVKTIERKYYKSELEKILSNQSKYHSVLTSSEIHKRVVEHLYPKNIAHKNNISNKDLIYLIQEDIIFYQRPLKSKKSSISNCQFEKRYYKKKDDDGNIKSITEPIKAIPKSHPLYQEFRLWQFVRNLRIIDSEKEVTIKNKNAGDVTAEFLNTEDDYIAVFDFLNKRGAVEEKHIFDYLVKLGYITKEDKKLEKYKWNYIRDKKYPCNTTRNDIIKRLSKVKGVEVDLFLTKEKELALWHIIYSVRDKKDFEKAILTFAKKNRLDPDSFAEAFKKMPPYSNDYGTLSQKAISKLLELMRMGSYWSKEEISTKTLDRIHKIIDGEYDENIRKRVREKAMHLRSIEDFKGLPLWLSSYIVYDRHSEVGEVAKWKNPEDIEAFIESFRQHSLRNPIVEQVVLETLRVVKDIWRNYGDGKEGYFTNINLELGRELKNSADKRERISKRNQENENTNARIRELLSELLNSTTVEGDIRPYSPSHQEILKIYEEGIYQNPNVDYSKVSEDEIDKIRKKRSPSRSEVTRYKLWLEQGYISPYTGTMIPLSKLFTTDYEIEHIIPQSRYFDNSLSNKIICEADVNQDKGNMTAFEYLMKKGGDLVDGHQLLELDVYENHCQKYFKKNRTKLANLLSEDIPEGFINRQMNDSRYIAKYVKGLLSNIVRNEGEQEPTSKHLLPVSGAITAKLKQDWGLNDKWNELVAPRFKRLNDLTKSTDYGYYDKKIGAFRTTVPDELRRGFSKKRIDHRHHALDAIVLACTTREHINYLNSLNSEKENYALRSKLLKLNKNGDLTKYFKSPWKGFAPDVLKVLLRIVVSFKQNTRVINKTNNKTWQWVKEDGNLKKKLVKQTKGDNWAIRKSLHKETVSGQIEHTAAGKNKIATATRVPLESIANQKHIDKISDIGIQKILNRHLANYIDDKGKPQFDVAFSAEGIEDMNKNIVSLNGGKPHMPIKKVRQYEIGTKFAVGSSGNNSKKFVEAAKGTNLFFAVYWDKKKEKRVYQTVPLNEVIEHQKQVAGLPKEDRLAIQPNPLKGDFLFTLSPNDLVFVPTEVEVTNPRLFDFQNPTVEQVARIYKMVSCTGGECHFIPISTAKEIQKNENGTNSKSERIQTELMKSPIHDDKGKGVMIKERCWKLKLSRVGEITKAYLI